MIALLAASAARAAAVATCWRCGRELTDPESIARGAGPECWARFEAEAERYTAAELAEMERRAMRLPFGDAA